MNHAHRPNRIPARRAEKARGFTMIELLISLTTLAIVMLIMTTVLFTTNRHKTATMNQLESAQASRVAVDMMARDLRGPGYDADVTWPTPQPVIAYLHSRD